MKVFRVQCGWIVVAVLATTFVLGGCGGAAPTVTGVSMPLTEFRSEAGGFSVMTPYALEERPVDTGIIETHTFMAQKDRTAWGVSYTDYPAGIIDFIDPSASLEASVAGATALMKGELVSKAEITLDEYPGREFTVRVPSDGPDAIYRARLFLVGNRLYQIMVVVPKGEENDETVTRFLESFQLIGE